MNQLKKPVSKHKEEGVMVSTVHEPMTLSERVAKEKQEVLSAAAHIDIDRIKIMMEVFRETDGQHPAIRRAKAFQRLCREKAIFLDESPLAGAFTKYKYGAYPLPEIGSRWMRRADSFKLPLGQAVITEVEREWIEKAADFWKDTNIFNKTRDVIDKTWGIDVGVLQKIGVAMEITPGGQMDTLPDYALALNRGLNGLLADIDQAEKQVDTGTAEGLSKWYFYQSARLSLDGMITLAKRYASLAREAAQKETDPARKTELERIAQICEWVPANPARDFREALQTVWFVTMGIYFENPTVGNPTPGRFGQYMYPFYRKDREEGKLTYEEAVELIQFYFLKLEGLSQALPPFGFKYSQARSALNLSIGGLTPEGTDATNELEWVILEAKRQLMVPEPLLCLLYHDGLSEEFLLKCVELISTGMGQPSFQDVRKSIQRNLLIHEGITLEQARDTAVVPCLQTVIPGCTDEFWEGHLNCAKMLELALNGGIDPLSGVRIGPAMGEPYSFESYEELYEAVIAELKYFIPLVHTIGRTAWNVAKDFPVPFASTLTYDCITKGRDLSDGGGRFGSGIGVSFTGMVDLANSLLAIKHLVFEEKKLTLPQLREALEADFEGYDEIRRMCLDVPKYGNGDDQVDSVVKELYRICGEEHEQLKDYLGRKLHPYAYSVASHGGLGEVTGALPNGRKAKIALTDASVSAQPGTDKNGPTALMSSAAKVIDTIKFGSNHLNMKFHPSTLESREKVRKLLSLIKTYMDMGGYHVQFNVVSADTLREARMSPEKYGDLIVRVAGFSAYFVKLDPVIQDEIITRTELSMA